MTKVLRPGDCRHPSVSDETIIADYKAGWKRDDSTYCFECEQWLWSNMEPNMALAVYTDAQLDIIAAINDGGG